MQNFTNKVALITGSSSGIGAAIAKAFAKNGANVIITGRRQEALDQVIQECNSLSSGTDKHLAFRAEVTKKDQLKSLVDATIEKYGRIDILINNAGGGTNASIFDDDVTDKIQSMMDLNLNSVVELTHLAAPHLEKTKGVIVNVSSIVAIRANPNLMPYCVAKAALDMFSRCLAIELGPKNIRVNCICPTAVRTNFQGGAGMESMFDDYSKYLESVIPLRRIGTVEDMANATLFLASDQSSFITGSNLLVDGGNWLTI